MVAQDADVADHRGSSKSPDPMEPDGDGGAGSHFGVHGHLALSVICSDVVPPISRQTEVDYWGDESGGGRRA